MRTFLRRFEAFVLGVLNGFDRVRFRGTIRWFAKPSGMMHFLWKQQVLLKDFLAFAKETTATLRTALEQSALEQERPVEYLASSNASKEQRAQQIATRDGIREGLIAVFKCVEPCMAYQLVGDRARQKLQLKLERGKCLHYYHYYLDRKLGWLHTRQQTWFPFTTFVCLNGREWLGRQMDAAELNYERRDNCFAWVEDLPRAQALLDAQLRTDWTALLEKLTRRSNPLHGRLFDVPTPHYWSVEESEWASDLLFRSQVDLAQLMPSVVRHGMLVLGSVDVLRFLGHPIPTHGGVNGHFAGEVTTDYKRRPEGVRIKHQVKKNWMKLYDKQGTVLRIETVINDVSDMKSYRSKENEPKGDKAWRRMRKGVADLHRRAEISQAANERYASSLATLEQTTPLKDLSEPLCQAVVWQGRRARPLNPLAAADAALLEAVSRGEFLLNGFRNRDVRTLLHGLPKDALTQRRQSAAVTRQLRLLRAHALIQKVPKTHRYQVSQAGQKVIAALLGARATDANQLLQAA
jgi:hypothetical protein